MYAFSELMQVLQHTFGSINRPVLQLSVKRTVVKSALVERCFIPFLSDLENSSWRAIVLSKTDGTISRNTPIKERVFVISWIVPGLYEKQSFVVMNGADEGDNLLLVVPFLLHLHLNLGCSTTGNYYTYVQYIEI